MKVLLDQQFGAKLLLEVVCEIFELADFLYTDVSGLDWNLRSITDIFLQNLTDRFDGTIKTMDNGCHFLLNELRVRTFLTL